MAEAQINLYELNQENYAKIEPLDPIWLNKKFQEIGKKMLEHRYWMLLCHENRDYTVFNTMRGTAGGAAADIKDVILNRGLVVDIEDKDDGAYEIWIKNNDKANAFYLFNYEEGVIECE